MNQATFIIDGYNVMRSILTRREQGGRLERARLVLESRLRAFRRASPGARIILVYDGARGVTASAEGEKGFEVHFSRPPRTADDVVVDLCRKLEGARGLHVVTSDWKDIASRVSALRLRHIASAEFSALVKDRIGKLTRGSGGAPEEAKPGGLPPGEVADWVRKFGFEDPGEESP